MSRNLTCDTEQPMKIKVFKCWSGEISVECDNGEFCDAIDITNDKEFVARGRVKSLRRLRVFMKSRGL